MVSLIGGNNEGSKSKRIVFDDDGEIVVKKSIAGKNKKKSSKSGDNSEKVKTEEAAFEPLGNTKTDSNNDGDKGSKSKRIVFDDNGAIVVKKNSTGKNKKKTSKSGDNSQEVKTEKAAFEPLANTKTDSNNDGGKGSKSKRIVFDDDGEIVVKKSSTGKNKKKTSKSGDNSQEVKTEEAAFEPLANTKTDSNNDGGKGSKSKRIVFDDDGEIVVKKSSTGKNKKKTSKSGDNSQEVKTEEAAFEPLANTKTDSNNDGDSSKKWYQVYSEFPATDEILDMKDSEQMELYNLCRTSYEQEKSYFMKKNPSDSRWLQTALHKGTAKDRANAGALLVTSNPLANLEALTTLVSSTKLSNKSCVEVIATLCDLWKEVLLPPHRKLYSVQMRGVDWKLVRKSETLSKEQQRKIYAYWHFENELKDLYFEFLKNLQQGIQTGQENNKTAAINAASLLLAYAPEKEQMLLTMLINKLGDPVAKIASKALHHLTFVAHKHPNMCGIIVTEAEKLLFRNNVSERAQHFALCYLSSIAPAGRPEVCTKLVNICFALFKVLVQKGAVNSRTMQAILRCLQKAIVDAKPAAGNSEILTKDMQDTIYRLVHLADIRVAIQTLGLLLQLVSVKTEKSDRFYNALYKKLLDLNLTTIGSKTTAQLLHILHRAIYIDSNIPRAKAFVKRLLQLALCAPPNEAAGCLIVIQKIHQTRKELCPIHGSEDNEDQAKILLTEDEMKKFDSDGEEKYEDVIEATGDKNDNEEDEDQEEKTEKISKKPAAIPSWHHTKVHSASETESKIREISTSKYDPYHRVPTYAGAEFSLQNELILLCSHYHPTIQVFAENILNNRRIDYYGDPLRDFGLAHFLERFSFKNPKKLDNKSDIAPVSHKPYVSYGARGMPVKSLTKNNCSEEEMFIFNYLEVKRKQSSHLQKTKNSEDSDDEDTNFRSNDVDDDEFEDYLDGFFGKKKKSKKSSADDDGSDADEFDFLKDLGGEENMDKKEKKTQRKKKSAENDEDIDDDWGDDDDENGDFEENRNSDDEQGSIDFDEDEEEGDYDDDDTGEELENEENDDDVELDESPDENLSNADSDDDSRRNKKKLKRNGSALNERSFAKKIKQSDDLTSLFAAADDFAELLEETSKTKGQGTSNAVFNRDKSAAKQLKWEETRRSGHKNYGKKSMQKGKFSKRK